MQMSIFVLKGEKKENCLGVGIIGVLAIYCLYKHKIILLFYMGFLMFLHFLSLFIQTRSQYSQYFTPTQCLIMAFCDKED